MMLEKSDWIRTSQTSKKKTGSKDITFMLFTRSHKKPMQWTLSTTKLKVMAGAFIVMVGLSLGSLVYSTIVYRNMQRVMASNESLVNQMAQMQEDKSAIETENLFLRSTAREKDQAYSNLSELTDKALTGLKSLQKRENEIRSRIGLASVQPSEEEGDTSAMMRMVDAQNDVYDSFSQQIASIEAAKAEKARAALSLRNGVVDLAEHYLGGRYVYGGENPTSGVDCSGFARYVLAHSAGVYLNRTAAAQSTQGKSVTISQAKPGDLIFYSNGSNVNHVAIYIGNGRVIHASNPRSGIIESAYNYRTPVAIKNVIGQ